MVNCSLVPHVLLQQGILLLVGAFPQNFSQHYNYSLIYSENSDKYIPLIFHYLCSNSLTKIFKQTALVQLDNKTDKSI